MNLFKTINRGAKIKEIGDFWNEKGLLPGMVMEEAGELIQAINKYERRHGDENRQAVVDEIGDLMIILMAYRYIHDIKDSEIFDRIDFKLDLKKED